MTDSIPPKVVKALYNFKATNNDELCFRKGDIINLTQAIEGGWWEGTLNGKTGWFPSNYVKEMKSDSKSVAKSAGVAKTVPDAAVTATDSLDMYHSVVLQSLIDSERTLVSDLQTVLSTYLRPLQAANILSVSEYQQLCGNIDEIYNLHEKLLSALDVCSQQEVAEQKIGGAFMLTAIQLKAAYHTYCSNHPIAVAILHKHKERVGEFVESQSAGSASLMTLIALLSKPFTRLDKYPNLLKELERHTAESHVDRGNTQRAISVYRDIATWCCDIRKRKEMEYEILHSAIKDWEGEEITTLGRLMLLSQVRVHAENGERKERLLLLFPGVLIVLSISPRMSGYCYEGKFPVGGMVVEVLEDTESYKHAFEITGTLIDRRVVSCSSEAEQKQWVDLIRQEASKSVVSQMTKPPQSLQISTSQPAISTLSQAKIAVVTTQNTLPRQNKSVWSFSCLRPCPPLRPSMYVKDSARSPRIDRKTLTRRKPDRSQSEDENATYDKKGLEDDALILRVIEAYRTSVKTRDTVNSLDLRKIRQIHNEGHLMRSGSNATTAQLVSTPDSIVDPVSGLALRRAGPGQAGIRGFCCAGLPITKSLAKSLKRI